MDSQAISQMDTSMGVSITIKILYSMYATLVTDYLVNQQERAKWTTIGVVTLQDVKVSLQRITTFSYHYNFIKAIK